MNNNNYNELLRQRQEQFIETRKTIELEVNKFLGSLQDLSEDIKVKCNVPTVPKTAQDYLPSLWQEPFDQDTYNRELEALNAFINSVRSVCDMLNQEALRCLQESQ